AVRRLVCRLHGAGVGQNKTKKNANLEKIPQTDFRCNFHREFFRGQFISGLKIFLAHYFGFPLSPFYFVFSSSHRLHHPSLRCPALLSLINSWAPSATIRRCLPRWTTR